MTISAIGSNNNWALNDDLTITTPSGSASGDILIACLVDDQADSAFVDAGSLFTELFHVESSSSRLTVLYYILTGSPAANYVFQTSSTGATVGILATFRKTGDTWDFVDQSGNDYTSAIGSGSDTLQMTSTDSATGGMLVTCWGSDEESTIDTGPGTQNQLDFENVTSVAAAIYYEVTSSSSITDSLVWAASGDFSNISFVLVESGGAPPSNILPNKCSIVIAGYNVTVSTGDVITVSKGDVLTTGLSANISAGKTISAAVGSVSISGINPSISAGKTISSGVGAIVATGVQASISTGATISVTLGAVFVSGVQANISAGKTIAVTVGSVAVAGANATVSNDNSINCSVGSVAVSGFNPNVSAGKIIAAAVGTIVSTGLQANVSAGKTIAGSTGSVSVTGINAEIIQSVIIEATTGAVIITGLAANISSGEIPEVPDERSFVINAENRVYSIESENRVYAIT